LHFTRDSDGFRTFIMFIRLYYFLNHRVASKVLR